DNRLRTSNMSAGQILDLPLADLQNDTLDKIAADYPTFKQFKDAIAAHLAPEHKEWREQISLTISNSRMTLMCSGTTLPETHDMQHGYVIVIDNITDLIQGQRNAALSEIARRLAHEIKNPLTPIQLATERLRHKYLQGMQQDDSDTFDRLTNTIIQQVETMKDMVNSFSEFSRTPEINLQSADLNALISEVLDLHANLNRDAEIVTDLDKKLPLALLDKGRMRQVFNNLLHNAFEACDKCTVFRLEISTRCITENNRQFIETRIKDSGTGVAEGIMDSMFDPYTTTKTKGTGLGLAIVKKIVEEHKGLVWLENNPSGTGACAIIRLPVTAIPVPTRHEQSRGQGVV
ncbi:MAG: sensor histidine kinase, partial [Gammaproteobacteria bacterium]